MPRKTLGTVQARERGRQASMRPRPDAAENGGSGADGADGSHASMRPRPDAAENDRNQRLGRYTDPLQ